MKFHIILKNEEKEIIEARMREDEHTLTWFEFETGYRQHIEDPSRDEARVWLHMRLHDIVDEDREYILEVFVDRYKYCEKGTISDRENVTRMSVTHDLF